MSERLVDSLRRGWSRSSGEFLSGPALRNAEWRRVALPRFVRSPQLESRLGLDSKTPFWTKTASSAFVLPLSGSVQVRNVDDAGCLDFNHSVRHQLDESGPKCFHWLYGFKEFDAYREVLATAAGSALGMEAVMRSKSRV